MVSIIVAVFNGGDYINRTLASALSQSVDVEVIVINDCSTDCSLRLLEEIAGKDKRVIIINNEYNVGFCKSVNKGLNVARGDYILVLGQDDILLPNHCEVMLKSFRENTSIVFCDYDLIDENDFVYDVSEHCFHGDVTIKDFYKHNAIPSVGLIMLKEKIKLVGGYPEDEDFPQYGEYHTWIRMVIAGNVVFNGQIRAYYRRHKNNISNSFNNREVIKDLNRYFCKCRKQILIAPTISLWDKAYVLMYMLYSLIKSSLLYKKEV